VDARSGKPVRHTGVIKHGDLASPLASPDVPDEFFPEICIPVFGAEFGCRRPGRAAHPANEPSLRLHEACGFKQVGYLPSVGYKFAHWTDVIMVQRSLGAGGATPPDVWPAASARPKERDVMALVVASHANKETAARFGIDQSYG
jgi:hypothetical protein